MSEDLEYIDLYIGNKIKERRKKLKLSQTKLAEMVNLSYQQLQKYENGKNKITMSRLMQLGKILNVPLDYFHEGIKFESDVIGKSIESDIIHTERTKPLRVLIIEDNPTDELFTRKAVEDSGEIVEVESLQDSEKVLDYLRFTEEKHGKLPPEIILLDLTMPKIDGITLLKMIKKDKSLASIPIIILTNSINTAEMQETYKSQGCGFIVKSVNYEHFSENIAIAIKYWSKVVVLPGM